MPLFSALSPNLANEIPMSIFREIRNRPYEVDHFALYILTNVFYMSAKYFIRLPRGPTLRMCQAGLRSRIALHLQMDGPSVPKMDQSHLVYRVDGISNSNF